MDSFEKYFNFSLRFLSYRPRSEKEVRDRLKRLIKTKPRHSRPASPKRQRGEPDRESDPRFREDDKGGNDEAIIEKIIARLYHLKFLNDEEFAKNWVDQRTRVNAKGPHVIKMELLQKGIDKEIIEKVLSNKDSKVAGEEKISVMLQKRFVRLKGLPPQEIRNKLGQFLLRRGFDYDTCKKLVDEILKKEV